MPEIPLSLISIWEYRDSVFLRGFVAKGSFIKFIFLDTGLYSNHVTIQMTTENTEKKKGTRGHVVIVDKKGLIY